MKQGIRQKTLCERRALLKSEVQEASMQIQARANHLQQLKNAGTVFVYMAMPDEVQTDLIMQFAFSNGTRVCVPVCVGDVIYAQKIDEGEKIHKNKHGILEPEYDPDKVVPMEEIDIAFVPGVAFDEKLTRLGFGKGYFDAFLHGFIGFIVGLAFECQMVEMLPCESHDVRMNAIITQKRTLLS